MFSFEDLEKLGQVMAQLSGGDKKEKSGKNPSHGKKYSKKGCEPGQKKNTQQDGFPGGAPCIQLTPSQLLVIAGFLTGGLEVNSVLVDKNQAIEIVLTGSLKRKTQLEKVMQQVGKMPFDEVMRAILAGSGE